MKMGLSNDTSLLALSTLTDVEIWDAQIGQCLHIIQNLCHGSMSLINTQSHTRELCLIFVPMSLINTMVQ